MGLRAYLVFDVTIRTNKLAVASYSTYQKKLHRMKKAKFVKIDRFGGDSNIPLSAISLTENVMMVGMAIWMLLI